MEAIPVYRQGLDEGSEFALRTQKLYQLPHMRFCVNLGEGLWHGIGKLQTHHSTFHSTSFQ